MVFTKQEWEARTKKGYCNGNSWPGEMMNVIVLTAASDKLEKIYGTIQMLPWVRHDYILESK